MNKPTQSDKQILSQIPRARDRAKRRLADRVYAEAARFDASSRTIQVSLANGSAFAVPVALIPDLRHAADDLLMEVELGPAGLSLRWDQLDADLSVVGLAQLVFGRETLLAAAGSAGGAVRSKAKAAAARSNGRKGGRPKRGPNAVASMKEKSSTTRAPTVPSQEKASPREAPGGARKSAATRRSR